MLTQDEFHEWCQRLGFSAQARAVIDQVRSSPPSRRVRSMGRNVSGRYPSRKMGVTIQFESHRVEFAAIYEMEHDEDVLEFYDQPPPIKLLYPDKTGRRLGIVHTPDFFVIRMDAAGWEEWKTEEELGKLAVRMAHRYVKADAGWQCPPGEQYAASFGLFYRVRSAAEIDWIYQRNRLFLEDYFHAQCAPVPRETADAILPLVAEAPGITLEGLLSRTTGITVDAIYALIAAGRLYVDLRAAPLPEPGRVRMFRDEETARAYAVITTCPLPFLGTGAIQIAAGASVAWDGRPWTILNPGETTIALRSADGASVEVPAAEFEGLIKQGKVTGLQLEKPPALSEEARERFARASPEDLKAAHRRYAVIAPPLAGQPLSDPRTPVRTARHWRSLWRKAELAYGCGFVGLLPRRRDSGNRRRKLPESTLAAMQEFIEREYETLKQKRKFEVYGTLVRACEARGILAPSYKAFAREVNRRPRRELVEKRQGTRAAYPHEPFILELELTTPRHGDRPFEIGHIDHTELDVELICSQTRRNLGRPRMTLLMDAFSRRMLAFYLTFDPPAYRSCMMVLRECVRRHGRLPQISVVDGGREFESIYFETLLARYQCTKKTRPAAKARFGSVCERLFGTTNTRFVHNLLGNTQIMRNVRQVTKAVNPKEHAVWTLGKLYDALCEWAYEVYDTIEHPALGQAPRAAFLAGLAQGGERLHRRIPFDEDFRTLTLPTTPRGTAKVIPGRGVKIRHLYYWADAFRDSEVEKTLVHVRYDPFDVGTAYAFVKGRWVRCVSERRDQFAGRSERELMLATAELRRQSQRHGEQFTITARRLAAFLASVESEETLLTQRLRDADTNRVLRVIDGGRGGENGQRLLSAEGAILETQSKLREPEQPPMETLASESGPLTAYEEYR